MLPIVTYETNKCISQISSVLMNNVYETIKVYTLHVMIPFDY